MQRAKKPSPPLSPQALAELAEQIRGWSRTLGFEALTISDTDLGDDEAHLLNWLDAGHHGEMEYMARHGTRRSRPAELEPGTLRVISVRMDYLVNDQQQAEECLNDPALAYISRYAMGRDYHKVLRQRLQKLATQIEQKVGPFSYRAFTDSAPVLEKALAQKSGMGWIGKHTNLINQKAGSWFFLGELYTDLPLPIDPPGENHCGTCQACIDCCPTAAIIAPYKLDARRCISYLTIELHGSIPVEFRALIGNRIYGCDDCQLFCPWNRFAQLTREHDFQVRHQLDNSALVELFLWSEQQFLDNTAGSAIRRIGHERWLRNIAVALGNAPAQPEIIAALQQRLAHPSEIVREHVQWALAQHPQ